MRLDEAARQHAIASALERVGRASVVDLAREFGVSAVTIRKDLSALEASGEISRVHGGATRTRSRDGGAFPVRLATARAAKQDIARRAAQLVKDGSVIALDSSTSAYFLAKHLLDRQGLVVVTYSIPTASLLLDASSASVHLVGGLLDRSARASAAVGLAALDLEVDMFFGGAHSATIESGLCEPDAEEATTKRGLATLAAQRYALLGSSKFDAEASFPWLPTDQITGIMTDGDVPDATAASWRRAGVAINTGR